MSHRNDEILRLCSKGELQALIELVTDLDKNDIELIRDESKARYTLI
jgi:hypothetical protein